MEGEIGRFCFPLYTLSNDRGECIERSADWFEGCRAREWYKTTGFREEAICLEATQRSYRTNVTHLNRSRRQESGGPPLTTLHYNAEQEGMNVLEHLEQASAELLDQHGFNELGEPICERARAQKPATPKTGQLSDNEVKSAHPQIREAMQKRGFSHEQIEQALERANTQVYEQVEHCTWISIDDVGVKEQSTQRRRKKEVSPQTAQADDPPHDQSSTRPTVQNTVAHIEKQHQCFVLSGSSLEQVLRFVMAFLLNNDLLTGRIHVFTDGLKSLQNTLLRFFAWHPGFWLVLDWYHLVKKFKEDLSLACRGRDLRNQHLRALTPLLWYGLVDQARDYLSQIPSSDLKDSTAIERLKKYLIRNQQAIPCYALRSLLRLRNASSPVESANNQLTARRQKRNGMSWSANGSWALTALSTVVANRCCSTWVNEHTIPLAFADNST